MLKHSDIYKLFLIFRPKNPQVRPLFLVLLFLFSSLAWSEFEISGEQDGVYEKGVYVATGDIIVNEGQYLVFEAGSVIKFHNYTGLIVYGSLECKGSEENPVIFTSNNDKQLNDTYREPLPLDWNGIEIRGSNSNISLIHTKISYSTFGLKVQHKETVKDINEVIFHDNGNGDLQIEEKMFVVDNYIPYTHTPNPPVEIEQPQTTLGEQSNSDSQTQFDVAQEKTPSKPVLIDNNATSEKKAKWKLPVRLSLGVLAIASGAIGAWSYTKYEPAYEDYKNHKKIPKDEWKKKTDTCKRYSTLFNVLAPTSGALCSAFIVTLFF